jgi:NAD(P)-dependent dehydrogenase (short-subunit alcohol dehydrogenase family)
MEIAGKTFLVTGGGSGLGEASAEELARRGGGVVVADLNEEGAKAQAEKLGEAVRAVACDVADESSVKAAVAIALEVYGGLHGVVHCMESGWSPWRRVRSRRRCCPSCRKQRGRCSRRRPRSRHV